MECKCSFLALDYSSLLLYIFQQTEFHVEMYTRILALLNYETNVSDDSTGISISLKSWNNSVISIPCVQPGSWVKWFVKECVLSGMVCVGVCTKWNGL